MQTNDAGIELIKRFEGLRLEPYQCSANKWTIGYGHTRGVSASMPAITEEAAEILLRGDLEWAEKAVNDAVEVPLNDNQFAALVSWTFNLGEGALLRSTMLKWLNQGDYLGVPQQMLKWDRAGGDRLLGLVRRRLDEAKLFIEPVT